MQSDSQRRVWSTDRRGASLRALPSSAVIGLVSLLLFVNHSS